MIKNTKVVAVSCRVDQELNLALHTLSLARVSLLEPLKLLPDLLDGAVGSIVLTLLTRGGNVFDTISATSNSSSCCLVVDIITSFIALVVILVATLNPSSL